MTWAWVGGTVGDKEDWKPTPSRCSANLWHLRGNVTLVDTFRFWSQRDLAEVPDAATDQLHYFGQVTFISRSFIGLL